MIYDYYYTIYYILIVIEEYSSDSDRLVTEA